MNKAIIGRKLGMTQLFGENGEVIPVTVIEAGPCFVSQKKTVDRDGYAAVQLAYEDVKEKHINRPELTHLKKAGITLNRKMLAELAVSDKAAFATLAEQAKAAL